MIARPRRGLAESAATRSLIAKDPGSAPVEDTLGARLRLARRQSGLTQAKLAAEAGVDTTYISHLEAGRRSPHPQVVTALADLLRVDPGWLLSGTASMASRLIAERLRFARFAVTHRDFGHCLVILDELDARDAGYRLPDEDRDQVDRQSVDPATGAGPHLLRPSDGSAAVAVPPDRLDEVGTQPGAAVVAYRAAMDLLEIPCGRPQP